MAATPAEPLGYTLWAGTVGFTSPLAERFAAAAATGCRQVTLSPPDVLRAAGDGMTAAEIGRQARDLGLDLIIDPVMNWYPDREPSPSRFAGVGTDDALRMCEALGVTSLSAIATASSDVPVPELASYLARLCDRAAGFGARVHLEFIPFTIVRTLRTAWDLVRAADRPNGGLVFDTWHFFRGEPQFDVLGRNSRRPDLLRSSSTTLRPSPEARCARRPQPACCPATATLDLVAAVRALHRIGALTLGRPGGHQPGPGRPAGAGRRDPRGGPDPGVRRRRPGSLSQDRRSRPRPGLPRSSSKR